MITYVLRPLLAPKVSLVSDVKFLRHSAAAAIYGVFISAEFVSVQNACKVLQGTAFFIVISPFGFVPLSIRKVPQSLAANLQIHYCCITS